MPMFAYAWHDVVGNLGVLTILGTYLALQAERLDAKSVAYSALNAVGAGSITISLLFDFNLSAFLVEAAWVLVSVYGLARAWRRPHAA
jgi:paired small multidrug resistance pump